MHKYTEHLGVFDDGVVVWQAAYLPYGEAQIQTNTVVNNLRFPGQYFDAETGLQYNWNRYYDPETGRYISADPIGLAGGLNLYAYVGGNPVNWTDPEGLFVNEYGFGDEMDSDGSQDQPQCGENNCDQDFLDCMAGCIRAYDPLSNKSKIGLTATGGTFPKSWAGLPRGTAQASPLTTVPSVTAHRALGGGRAGTLGGATRALGRLASPLWIGYGIYLFGMEGYCAISCAGNRCAH